MQVTSLLRCGYFQPINKDCLGKINIFHWLANSSLCCIFSCNITITILRKTVQN